MHTDPESFEGSAALHYVKSKGWNYRVASEPNIEIENCPACKHGNYHFRMAIHGSEDPNKNRDGLFSCVRCGKAGNLFTLQQMQGDVVAGLESRKDWSGERKTETLPDTDEAHQALLEDAEVLDYLINIRGFSKSIIERQKIGIVQKRWFRDTGEVKALVYPYLVGNNTVFVHYRTLPPDVKAFSSPTGWAVPLYNGSVLNNPSLKDVILVEGEPDTIAGLDHGIENICGVPGANIKKAEWIDQLDKLERIYICYDPDSAGQKGAQDIANRIGIEKCWKIVLPAYELTDDTGVSRRGKDLNDWFRYGGGTLERWEGLKQEAQLFDVAGVAASKDAVQEFLDELDGKEGLAPKYTTQWRTQNTLVGFEPGDVIDILAPEKIGKTTYAMNLMEHMVDTYGEDGVFICLEMTRARMARKWIAHKAQIADNIPKTPEEALALKARFQQAIPEVQQMAANREGDFYFCYPKYKTVDDIYNLIRDCIRRYGVKWIAIDNIQRLCDTTLGSKQRTQHLSEISKTISQIAKDFNVQIVRILQPHRIMEGKIATSNNVDGASQIGKDCDAMIILHRESTSSISSDDVKNNGFIYEETSFGEDMLVTVGLSRYSGGGRTTLHYNGATSTILEKNEGQIAKMQANSNKNVGYEGVNRSLGLPITNQTQRLGDEAIGL